MILERNKQRVDTLYTDAIDTDHQIAFSIDTNAQALIIDRLTDLYNDPLDASIREIISNAIDATVACASDKPIDVYAPTEENPFLTIRDYSLGMSLEDLETIYTKFGTSTKVSDNEQIGAYGLGAKAPLSYTHHFYIRSIYQGQVHRGMVARTEEGLFLNLENPQPTSKLSGLQVTIPIKEDDVERTRALLNKYFYTNPLISNATLKFHRLEEPSGSPYQELIKLNISEDDTLAIYGDAQGAQMFYRPFINFLKSQYLTVHTDKMSHDDINALKTILHNPISLMLDNYTIQQIVNEGNFILQGYAYKSKSDKTGLQPFLIELKPGYVDFSSSRDAIVHTEKTKQFLETLYQKLQTNAFTHLQTITPEQCQIIASNLKEGARHGTNTIIYENQVVYNCETILKLLNQIVPLPETSTLKKVLTVYDVSANGYNNVIEQGAIYKKDGTVNFFYRGTVKDIRAQLTDTETLEGHELYVFSKLSDAKTIVLANAKAKDFFKNRPRIHAFALGSGQRGTYNVIEYTGSVEEATVQFPNYIIKDSSDFNISKSGSTLAVEPNYYQEFISINAFTYDDNDVTINELMEALDLTANSRFITGGNLTFKQLIERDPRIALVITDDVNNFKLKERLLALKPDILRNKLILTLSSWGATASLIKRLSLRDETESLYYLQTSRYCLRKDDMLDHVSTISDDYFIEKQSKDQLIYERIPYVPNDRTIQFDQTFLNLDLKRGLTYLFLYPRTKLNYQTYKIIDDSSIDQYQLIFPNLYAETINNALETYPDHPALLAQQNIFQDLSPDELQAFGPLQPEQLRHRWLSRTENLDKTFYTVLYHILNQPNFVQIIDDAVRDAEDIKEMIEDTTISPKERIIQMFFDINDDQATIEVDLIDAFVKVYKDLM